MKNDVYAHENKLVFNIFVRDLITTPLYIEAFVKQHRGALRLAETTHAMG